MSERHVRPAPAPTSEVPPREGHTRGVGNYSGMRLADSALAELAGGLADASPAVPPRPTRSTSTRPIPMGPSWPGPRATRRPAPGAEPDAGQYHASHQPTCGGSVMAVSAYILIQTEVGKAAQVASEVRSIDGVVAADDVTGPYDVVVRAEAGTMDELGRLVVSRVQMIEGITRTLTCPVVHL